MSLCIATGGQILALVASSFTLSWTHSVEKTEWIEHWQVEDSRLNLVSASVQGSGAGRGQHQGGERCLTLGGQAGDPIAISATEAAICMPEEGTAHPPE